MKKQNLTHSRLIEILEKRVLNKHPNADTFRNVEYGIGEIDLFCTFDRKIKEKKEKIAYIFEMKSSDSSRSLKKAYKQLEKHKLHYLKKSFYNKTYFFYVYGLGRDYNIKRVF